MSQRSGKEPIWHEFSRDQHAVDATERFIPMFTEERNSDTVKRIRISEKDTLFFVTLIEHKTKVDYNVSMDQICSSLIRKKAFLVLRYYSLSGIASPRALKIS